MDLDNKGIRILQLPHRYVIERDWKRLDLIRAQAEPRLPAILSVQEVRQRLSMATPLHHRVSFTTVYHLGLRLQEGLFLQASDIDGQRLMGHVHRGKGAKDRYVPVKALSPIYRALFKAQITQAGALDHMEPQVWKTPWHVHSQATPGATSSLKYLAP